jgi:hypothetical protein
MAVEKLRGTVSHLTILDKHGAAKCRLDSYTIMIPAALVRSFREGETVEVAGTIKNGALHVMAVKNIRQDKITRVDVTSYVMMMAVAGFLWVLFCVLGLRELGTGELLAESFDDIISFAGFVVVLLAIRHVHLINRASDQLTYPWL